MWTTGRSFSKQKLSCKYFYRWAFTNLDVYIHKFFSEWIFKLYVNCVSDTDLESMSGKQSECSSLTSAVAKRD